MMAENNVIKQTRISLYADLIDTKTIAINLLIARLGQLLTEQVKLRQNEKRKRKAAR